MSLKLSNEVFYIASTTQINQLNIPHFKLLNHITSKYSNIVIKDVLNKHKPLNTSLDIILPFKMYDCTMFEAKQFREEN